MTSRLQALDDYDPDREVDLEGFAGSMATYSLAVSALAALAQTVGTPPERYALGDVLLGGLATHKFSRLLAKGSITSPVRAPFTQFVEAAGSSEQEEQPRGHGVRHTVGELLTCPFCLGVWVGTGYVAGLALAPRATRAWAAVFAVTGVSDFLQHAYSRVRAD